ncbi:hypothetical protein PHLGIDRAFT_175229 [Phlebiopsis gigantea 11061_1 CR5-6]|uniref:Uncharacterized protein n=1 Tax=Phlebiopsis gigantea (strain 11061_1 CR5-6) TaxID=745531 RepID=A0A0C3RUY1_PHLG1|nr:hypothetical protein PHLGIDRAFT_175229 [Phlebiopsis gigantea 11061_1 CR5-6]
MTILQEEFLHQASALIFTHHFHASKKNPVRVSLKKLEFKPCIIDQAQYRQLVS